MIRDNNCRVGYICNEDVTEHLKKLKMLNRDYGQTNNYTHMNFLTYESQWTLKTLCIKGIENHIIVNASP